MAVAAAETCPLQAQRCPQHIQQRRARPAISSETALPIDGQRGQGRITVRPVAPDIFTTLAHLAITSSIHEGPELQPGSIDHRHGARPSPQSATSRPGLAGDDGDRAVFRLGPPRRPAYALWRHRSPSQISRVVARQRWPHTVGMFGQDSRSSWPLPRRGQCHDLAWLLMKLPSSSWWRRTSCPLGR